MPSSAKPLRFPHVHARTALRAVAGVVLWGLVVGVGRAAAQTQQAGGAVDAGVADLDPRAASLRRVEPGNAQFSFESRLHRVQWVRPLDFSVGWQAQSPLQAPRANPAVNPIADTRITPWRDPATGLLHHQPRRYSAPGLRALVDRPLYLVPHTPEGTVDPNAPRVALIGANTVFELTPERPAARRPMGPPPRNLLDTQLNLRVGPAAQTPQQARRIMSQIPQPLQPKRTASVASSSAEVVEPVKPSAPPVPVDPAPVEPSQVEPSQKENADSV